MLLDERIVACQAPVDEFIYCVSADIENFDPVVFDEYALRARGLTDNKLTAGRGQVVFLNWESNQLVLRHYRRGGLVRFITKDLYCFLGLQRTRALREISILIQLVDMGLPVPQPYACRVVRHGFTYSASLITHRLPGVTLADRLRDQSLDSMMWKRVGECIAKFHAAGVYHADLNAHNILIEDSHTIYLIDFDRAEFRKLPRSPGTGGWCWQNLQRLSRSIHKLSLALNLNSDAKDHTSSNEAHPGFSILKQQWAETLTRN